MSQPQTQTAQEKQCWQHEFSAKFQPPAEIVNLIEAHVNVADDSWHNDMCPHLAYYAKIEDRGRLAPKVELWWDAIQSEDREYPERMRYMVILFPQREDGNQGRTEKTVLTDDANQLVRTFYQFVAESQKAQTTMEIVTAIAEEMRQRGFQDASAEGFLGTVTVSRGEHIYTFGTANETWGGDVYENSSAYAEGKLEWSVTTSLSSRETNAQLVAAALAGTVAAFEAEHHHTRAQRDFVAKLQAFCAAGTALLGADWEGTGNEPASRAAYPFSESFDEILLKMGDWSQAVEALVYHKK